MQIWGSVTILFIEDSEQIEKSMGPEDSCSRVRRQKAVKLNKQNQGLVMMTGALAEKGHASISPK